MYNEEEFDWYDYEYGADADYYNTIDVMEEWADQLSSEPQHADLLRERLEDFVQHYSFLHPDRIEQINEIEQYVRSALKEIDNE